MGRVAGSILVDLSARADGLICTQVAIGTRSRSGWRCCLFGHPAVPFDVQAITPVERTSMLNFTICVRLSTCSAPAAHTVPSGAKAGEHTHSVFRHLAIHIRRADADSGAIPVDACIVAFGAASKLGRDFPT
jgi:hypothetical protein